MAVEKRRSSYNKWKSLWAEILHVHGIVAICEMEVALLLLLLAKAKGAVLSHSWSNSQVLTTLFLVIRKVLLDDGVGLHVDLFVGIVLTVMDLFHAAALLNEERISVDWLTRVLRSFLVHVADLENIFETIKGNLNNLVVGAGKQVAQWPDAAALNEITDLVWFLEST